MDNETNAAEEQTGSRHLSRRRVLKTAAHAAWVVPAIQVVSIAPAFAASPPPAGTLQVTAIGHWTLGSPDIMTATIDVMNSSETEAVSNVAVTLTFRRFYVSGARTITISDVTGAGWSTAAGIVSGSGNPKTADVTFSNTTQGLAHGASLATLSFTVTTSRNVTNAAANGTNDNVSIAATGDVAFTGAGELAPVLLP